MKSNPPKKLFLFRVLNPVSVKWLKVFIFLSKAVYLVICVNENFELSHFEIHVRYVECAGNKMQISKLPLLQVIDLEFNNPINNDLQGKIF